jgi:hypothetical protein
MTKIFGSFDAIINKGCYMDNEMFSLLAKFMVRSKRFVGALDSERLLSDRQYAASICQKIEEMGDEEDVLLALTFKHKLGLLQNVQASAPGGITVDANSDSTDKKYTFGARG